MENGGGDVVGKEDSIITSRTTIITMITVITF